MTAAKEKTADVFPLAAFCLAETRVPGIRLEKQVFIGPKGWVSSTVQPGYRYTASGELGQRWYASNYGRFTTADPYQASGGPKDPGSWNRYAYVEGDPINFYDPEGLFTTCAGPFLKPSPDGYGCVIDNSIFSNGSGTSTGSSHGGSGSSGGGYTQTGPIPRPYKEADLTTEAEALADAYDLALGLLNSSKCAGLFNIGGSGLGPAALLKALYNGNDDFGTINWKRTAETSIAETAPGIAPSPNGGTIAIISLNDNLNGGWFSQTGLQDAQTLLHELGHAYQLLYGQASTAIKGPDGNPDDPNQKAAQGANQSLISILCH